MRAVTVVTRHSRYEMVLGDDDTTVLFVKQNQGSSDVGLPQDIWLGCTDSHGLIELMERITFSTAYHGTVTTGLVVATIPRWSRHRGEEWLRTPIGAPEDFPEPALVPA